MVESKSVNYLITKLLPAAPTGSVMKPHQLLISLSPLEHARSDKVTAWSDSLLTWKKKKRLHYKQQQLSPKIIL